MTAIAEPLAPAARAPMRVRLRSMMYLLGPHRGLIFAAIATGAGHQLLLLASAGTGAWLVAQAATGASASARAGLRAVPDPAGDRALLAATPRRGPRARAARGAGRHQRRGRRHLPGPARARVLRRPTAAAGPAAHPRRDAARQQGRARPPLRAGARGDRHDHRRGRARRARHRRRTRDRGIAGAVLVPRRSGDRRRVPAAGAQGHRRGSRPQPRGGRGGPDHDDPARPHR